MKKSLTSLGEFGLIQKVKRILPSLPKHRWVVGLGDDTSVLRLNSNHYQLFTHDLLLEGIHFIARSPKDYLDLGWKALAVNLSDIAAMGGIPQEAVVGLGIPPKTRLSQVESFYRGLATCAKKFHCPIVGGDTNRSKKDWVISVSITGFSARMPLLRRGARPGDGLWVTGTLGGAALGWKSRQKKNTTRSLNFFRRQHARPEPRLYWGQRLQERGSISAMMDISDGLAGDLEHLARASDLGFEVELDKLPRPRGYRLACQKLRVSEIDNLIGRGEDYELVFTVKKDHEAEFSRWLETSPVKATRIGRATATKKVKFLDSQGVLFRAPKGFRHF